MSLSLSVAAGVVQRMPAFAHALVNRSFHTRPIRTLTPHVPSPLPHRHATDIDDLITRMQAMSISTSATPKSKDRELQPIPEGVAPERNITTQYVFERDITALIREAKKLANRVRTVL